MTELSERTVPRKRSMRVSYVLGIPINIGLELGIQMLSLLLPALALLSLRGTGSLLKAAGALLLAVYAYPLAILLLTALATRLLPKPPLGYLDQQADRMKYQTLIALNTFMRRTPARWLLVFPFPGYWFYKIAGTNIASTALITHPNSVPDPYLVSIGQNSVLGFGCLVLGHYAPDPSTLLLGRVLIGDGVMIGADAIVWPNVRIGHGAVVQNKAVVAAGTIIPANEIWGGVPARRIADVAGSRSVTQASTGAASEREISGLVTEAMGRAPIDGQTRLAVSEHDTAALAKVFSAVERTYGIYIDRTEVDLRNIDLNTLVELVSRGRSRVR